jgi:hypothetical protein
VCDLTPIAVADCFTFSRRVAGWRSFEISFCTFATLLLLAFTKLTQRGAHSPCARALSSVSDSLSDIHTPHSRTHSTVTRCTFPTVDLRAPPTVDAAQTTDATYQSPSASSAACTSACSPSLTPLITLSSPCWAFPSTRVINLCVHESIMSRTYCSQRPLDASDFTLERRLTHSVQ